MPDVCGDFRLKQLYHLVIDILSVRINVFGREIDPISLISVGSITNIVVIAVEDVCAIVSKSQIAINVFTQYKLFEKPSDMTQLPSHRACVHHYLCVVIFRFKWRTDFLTQLSNVEITVNHHRSK
jgi:hypothetical protein